MNLLLSLCSTLLILMPFAQADSTGPFYECAYINCDCNNLDWGILTGPFRDQCRSSEKSIKDQCINGTPLSQLSCDPAAYGPKAYPMAGRPQPTPEENADKQIDELCKRLRGQLGDAAKESPYLHTIRALQPVQKDFPGMGLVLRAGQLRAQNADALTQVNGADFMLKGGDSIDKEVAPAVTSQLIATAKALDSSLADPEKQLELNRVMEKLISLGLAASDATGSDSDLLEYLETLQKLHKAAYSAAQLQDMKDNRAKQLVESVMDLLPETANPILNGPMSIAVSDQLQWSSDLYKHTTSAMDLVSSAIESGHFDSEAYQKISDQIQTLALEGPWGKSTALGALKKWSEQIPFLGKLIKVFIEDPEKAKGGLPAFCFK